MSIDTDLELYLRNGFNILMSGKHGVGKSSALMAAVRNLGWALDYYSAGSLDPFVDLVGIPHVNDDKTLEMVRPHRLDKAEVVFFDELNRADDKTLNAVFEMIQFKTINGEPLPNLKAVVAGINPPGDEDEYKVNILDPALVDRFHIVINMEPDPLISTIASEIDHIDNVEIATALVTWWNGHDKKKVAYISPRRLSYIGQTWSKIPKMSTIDRTMPPDGLFDTGKLFTMLNKIGQPVGEDGSTGVDLGNIVDLLTISPHMLGNMETKDIIASLNATPEDDRMKAWGKIMVLAGEFLINEHSPLIAIMTQDEAKVIAADYMTKTKRTRFTNAFNNIEDGKYKADVKRKNCKMFADIVEKVNAK